MDSNEDTKKSNKFRITIEPPIFLLTLGGIIQVIIIKLQSLFVHHRNYILLDSWLSSKTCIWIRCAS